MPSFATPAAWTAAAVRVISPPFSDAASSLRSEIEHYALTWRGIDVCIAYERHSTGLAECPYSHLEVMTDKPRRPLPMTETGYKSLFLPAGSIEAEGGPVEFVTRWLDHAAQSHHWKAVERDMRQGSLF